MAAVIGRAFLAAHIFEARATEALVGFFFRIDHLQVLDAALAAFLSDDPCKWADARLVDVGDFECRRIEFVGSAHARDDGCASCSSALDELQLCRNGIDAVEHVIVLREIKLVCRCWQEEALVRCNVASRIDVANTFGSNFDFQTSDDAVRSDDLAVQVRDPDFVVVAVDRGHIAEVTEEWVLRGRTDAPMLFTQSGIKLKSIN